MPGAAPVAAGMSQGLTFLVRMASFMHYRLPGR